MKNLLMSTFHFSLCAFLVLINGVTMAHDGEEEHLHVSINDCAREWRLEGSTKSWEGTFVTASESIVQVRHKTGLLRKFEIAKLSSADQQWIACRRETIRELNSRELFQHSADQARQQQIEGSIPLIHERGSASGKFNLVDDAPTVAKYFSPFEKSVTTRWDHDYLYVESYGIPDHEMMTGIKAWQQQVPLPQNYKGENAWRIPLKPVPAKNPMSTKEHFFRGAIALAVNGVPIFNPIKNDGRTDTLLAGELDEWGGHCGRGDDYHYHIAPVHLERLVGKGNPVAIALDGYPIYGYQDPSASDFKRLDEWNGHQDKDGNYHYHATKEYPYLNGGFYGEVVERDGQVDPQPRAFSPRPALPPMKGALITGFERNTDGLQFSLTYRLRNEERFVRYKIDPGKKLEMEFDEGVAGVRRESWSLLQERERGGRTNQRRPNDPPLPGKDENRGQLGTDGRSPGDRQRSQDSRPSDGSRKPWLEVHAREMDSDSDGILTRKEMLDEAEKAFSGYDKNRQGEVSVDSLKEIRSVRSAMGGFIRQHASEIDRDNDGKIQRIEVIENAGRMFDKTDSDKDGKFTIPQETEQATPPPDQKKKPKPDKDSKRGENSAAGEEPASGSRNAGDKSDDKFNYGDRSIATGKRSPNIILVLLDDMGWRDVGFAGNNFVETPNIDRLAQEGLNFRQAYASAPNCAPTRACLMSGQYTPRHGVFTVVDPRHDPGQPHHRILASKSNEALDGKVITIAELLKERNYSTAFLGMWNLGRGRTGPTTPSGQGFDLAKTPKDFGFEQNAYFDPQGRSSGDVLTSAGLDFIEANRDRPFFLYLALHDIHAPHKPKPELLAKYEKKSVGKKSNQSDPTYAAMVEGVDQNIGRIMQKLKDLKLDQDTMVVFTSDNGGTPQYVSPLNGSKGALYEGGIRVPCAVWWSGIKEPGRISEEPILSMDFYPTIAALADAKLPENQPIDGLSLLPILKGEQKSLEREAVFWHFPCYVGRGEPASAIRKGEWKLIQKFVDGAFELYNLNDDPGEKQNLVSTNPARFIELKTDLTRWQKEIAAPLPKALNPAFDPNSQPARGRGKTGNNENRKNK